MNTENISREIYGAIEKINELKSKTTEVEHRLLNVKNEFELMEIEREEKKDTMATAIKSGFEQIGAAIARTSGSNQSETTSKIQDIEQKLKTESEKQLREIEDMLRAMKTEMATRKTV